MPHTHGVDGLHVVADSNRPGADVAALENRSDRTTGNSSDTCRSALQLLGQLLGWSSHMP